MERVYGLNVYNAMISHYEIAKTTNERLDIRAIHTLIEHKAVMIERIKFLGDCVYKTNFDTIREYFSRTLELLTTAKSLELKYSIAPSNDILNRIQHCLLKAREFESVGLEFLIDN